MSSYPPFANLTRLTTGKPEMLYASERQACYLGRVLCDSPLLRMAFGHNEGR